MSQIEEQEDILKRKLVEQQQALEKNLQAVRKQNMVAAQQRQKQFAEQQKRH